MDSELLYQGLINLNGKELRTVYALLTKVKIIDLVTSKVKDKLASDGVQNHFSEHINLATEQLASISDDELRLELFLKLLETYKIPGDRFDLKNSVVNACEEIVAHAFAEYVEKHKKIKNTFQDQKVTSKLTALITWQMNDLFKSMDSKISDLSVDDQDDLIHKVSEYIHSLPKEQQDLIKDKLGIQEVSDKAIKSIAYQNGISILFAILVEVCGFSFYTTAMWLIASMTGIFGITLPFAAYTSAASMIAFLANPIVMLPMLFGGGLVLIHYQNKILQRKMIPVILMQVILPIYSGTSTTVGRNTLSATWLPKYQKYLVSHQQLKKLRIKRNNRNRNLWAVNKEIDEFEQKKVETTTEIEQNMNKFIEQLKNDSNPSDFLDLKKEVGQANKRIAKLKELMEQEKRKAVGFFALVKSSLQCNQYKKRILNIEKEVDALYYTAAKEIMAHYPLYAPSELEAIKRLQKMKNEVQQKLMHLYRQQKINQKEVNDLNHSIGIIQEEISNQEKVTYGLNDLILG